MRGEKFCINGKQRGKIEFERKKHNNDLFDLDIY